MIYDNFILNNINMKIYKYISKKNLFYKLLIINKINNKNYINYYFKLYI